MTRNEVVYTGDLALLRQIYLVGYVEHRIQDGQNKSNVNAEFGWRISRKASDLYPQNDTEK